jgi:arylsulfatase A-like enzyme
MLPAKGPFVYQENNNVPLVVRWPGRLPAGTETGALCQSPDFFPTMMDLAGIENRLDYLPGQSVAGLLRDPATGGPNQHVLMGFEYSRESDFVKSGKRVGLDPAKAPLKIRAVHDGRYKYARYYDEGLDDEYELYDLHNDPGEMINLAGDSGYRAIQKEMADKLKEAETTELAPVLRAG